ncbi:MAG: hypothetical protein ACFFD7_08260 [Candidatus Thorarchaeota archaeon]
MKQLIIEFLEDHFAQSNLNKLPKSYGGGKIFSKPLIGIARGDDPIFEKFKLVAAPRHMTPSEMWVASGCSDTINLSAQLRIISIVCPFSDQIRKESMKAELLPAEIYSIGRNYANAFKIDVLKKLIGLFQSRGFQATAGMLSEAFDIYEGLLSTWSERHIAFAAGLGTFSLHEGLITEVGCNIRLCSVITNAPLEVTPRQSDDPYANCLFYNNENCRECEKKCPGDAIDKNGHDKLKCRAYGRKVQLEMIKRLGSVLKPHWRRIRGEYREVKPPVGCAFCQFGVPCMDKNPMASKK